MIQKTLSILFVIATIAILFSPLFFVSADNEDLPPVHSHTRVIHGPDASRGGPMIVIAAGCTTATLSVKGVYYVGVETCTHGKSGGVGCTASINARYAKVALCHDNGSCGGDAGTCNYAGCTCSSS